jgi:hypothetical protein
MSSMRTLCISPAEVGALVSRGVLANRFLNGQRAPEHARTDQQHDAAGTDPQADEVDAIDRWGRR